MRRIVRGVLLLVLAVLVAGSAVISFWLGIVPQRYSPFRPLSLEAPPGLFLDFQLAALRRDPALCQAVLKAPYIEAAPVPDRPFKDRCGWRNAVRVTAGGGVTIGAEPLTCEMAAALALWIEHGLQPAATRILGSRVSAIEDMGTYDCRNIIGSRIWRHTRSEHASANAFDIAGFRLEDGRRIGVLSHWKGKGPEARFLREAHARACRYFRVALGPEFNAAHKDHLHLDRGILWTCK
jgi:hypothetical protein